MSHSQLDEESRIRKIITLSIAGLLISAVSFSGGMVFAQSSLAKPGSLLEQINVSAGGNNFKTSIKDFDSDLFAEVWKLLQRDYVDHNELDQKKMFYGALHGLVASTGDPYTMFFDPEENKEFKTDVSGKFEGIGAEIGLKDDLITVIAPLEGMPAEKAGVRAGDKIIAIDEASTVGMTVDQAVKKIRGAGGTKVVLSILRDKAKTPIKISIERGVIVIKSVKKTVKDGVNIIRISSFSQDTEAEFNQAVSEVLASKSKDLIIDLRNNPGGYLDVAIAMIGRWIGDEVAVIEKYSQDKQT
ncbi:MAG TPA: S41 family peptidase, partial [bacterium]|nr:S41 family peptidase [bacterium]